MINVDQPDLAALRRDYDRHRVSAEYCLPLDQIEGSSYDEMRRNAARVLMNFRSTR